MASKRTHISAKAPVIGGRQYHIDCAPGDVAKYVLLPGDPARVGKIASSWDASREIANHREYHTMTGSYKKVPLSCTSTGIGAPSLAIGVDELSRIGADTFIRVGSTGALQKGVHMGDLIITTGAVRLDGASKDFVIPEYPAVASYEVVMALIQAAEELKAPYHVGITASTDTFYTGQSRPALGGYMPSFKERVLEDMQRARVLNFEMESGCLLTMANVFGKRAGVVCFAIANRATDEFRITDAMAVRAGKVASHAVYLLSQWDREKKKRGKAHLYPSLI
jgi:uridine phosphorylase